MSIQKTKKKAYIIANVTFKPHSEGGRGLMPVGDGYAPYLRSAVVKEDLAVRINGIPKGAEQGEVITVEVELTYYDKMSYGELSKDLPVELIEGPKTVASGICVSQIILPESTS